MCWGRRTVYEFLVCSGVESDSGCVYVCVLCEEVEDRRVQLTAWKLVSSRAYLTPALSTRETGNSGMWLKNRFVVRRPPVKSVEGLEQAGLGVFFQLRFAFGRDSPIPGSAITSIVCTL